ncbi:Carnitine monooxygenase oxygenase subunit [Streptomyces sp. enrichment culture]|uniref:aromatic ring-hydroxylating oxygenase subunit alpha n=1 Tax=Streptomyces sp. enrichment culture TaxID=1795815 RepID=UPI003F56E783
MTTTPVPPSLIAAPPGHHYTDPEVFRQEQERIVESMWFCAVHSADPDKPGVFRTVRVGRGNVVVARTRTGALRAFLNVCRHCGARLCLEESGEVRRAFRCPYHAWTYDLDGKLTAAPDLTRMPDVDRVEYGLVGAALREWLGYAWVCLAPEPPSFEETVVGAAERLGDPAAIEHHGTEELAPGRRITYDVKANRKLLAENFVECCHCATIRPGPADVPPEFAEGYAAQCHAGHGAGFGEDVKGFTVDGSEGFGRLPEVAADQDRRYHAITVKPTVFVDLVPDHVIPHRVFPLAEDRTVVECDWLHAPEVVASGADVPKSVELFHRVNSQDFEACERTRPAMSSRAYRRGGVLVPTEHHIGSFHEWLLGSPGVGPRRGAGGSRA